MKGVSGTIVMAVVSLFVMGIMITISQGTAGDALDFTRAQAVDQQTQRIANAILTMESVPEGHMALEMSDYQIKYDSGDRNLTLNYTGRIGSYQIPEYLMDYDRVEAPTELEPIDQNLCIEKRQDSGEVLVLNSSGCGN